MNIIRRLRREEGQAAVEFLLVLPFLFAFFLLLIDLGLLTYDYVAVSNGVREGARYGAVNCASSAGCTANAIAERVADRSGGILNDASEVTVGWIDLNGDGNRAGRGDTVVVRANHSYNFLFFPASISVVACADMRLEEDDQGTGHTAGTAC
jgi:Flp pilus assembly protein TadG